MTDAPRTPKALALEAIDRAIEMDQKPGVSVRVLIALMQDAREHVVDIAELKRPRKPKAKVTERA